MESTPNAYQEPQPQAKPPITPPAARQICRSQPHANPTALKSVVLPPGLAMAEPALCHSTVMPVVMRGMRTGPAQASPAEPASRPIAGVNNLAGHASVIRPHA